MTSRNVFARRHWGAQFWQGLFCLLFALGCVFAGPVGGGIPVFGYVATFCVLARPVLSCPS